MCRSGLGKLVGKPQSVVCPSMYYLFLFILMPITERRLLCSVRNIQDIYTDTYNNICIYKHKCIYIMICIHRCLYMYIYVCVCVYIYVYV